MQSILSVFRSIGNLEKSVETCQISLPVLEALLIIEFKCKYGIVKLFNLRYFETTAVDVSTENPIQMLINMWLILWTALY